MTKIMNTIIDQLNWMSEDSALFNNDDSPFAFTHRAGRADLAVLVGDNATGKSLLVRAIARRFHADHKGPVVSISIRERTRTGIERAFMFGDEVMHSTGSVSARTVQTALRQHYDNPWMLVFDEPEIGLSEGYAEALGELIAKSSTKLDNNCTGIIVVTHSRRLVQGMVRGSVEDLTFAAMQKDPITIEEWLNATDRKTVEELEALRLVATERFRAMNALTNKIKEEQHAE